MTKVTSTDTLLEPSGLVTGQMNASGQRRRKNTIINFMSRYRPCEYPRAPPTSWETASQTYSGAQTRGLVRSR